METESLHQMRISALKSLLFAVPMASVLAQTPTLQMNVVYECQAPTALNSYRAGAPTPSAPGAQNSTVAREVKLRTYNQVRRAKPATGWVCCRFCIGYGLIRSTYHEQLPVLPRAKFSGTRRSYKCPQHLARRSACIEVTGRRATQPARCPSVWQALQLHGCGPRPSPRTRWCGSIESRFRLA